MRKDLTDIIVVMDRSGSMSSTHADAEGGLNTFIKEQQKQPGEAVFTLVQFDTEYEFVHKAVPIQKVGHVTLEPRGMTALLDAVGRAMVETGERLKALPEEQRPGLVVFTIVTDGGENSSKEFKWAKVREMIEHQQTKYQWQFQFIGTDIATAAQAQQMGISIRSTGVAARLDSAYLASTSNVTRMRHAVAMGASASHANAYTDEERKAMARKKDEDAEAKGAN